MTVAIKRTPVEAKWTIPQIQQEASRAFATNCMAAMQIISKHGEPAVKEYQDLIHKFQLEHLKSKGVKNPLELAKAKAEFETNVFGSKIDVEGDENRAVIIYNSCAMWEAMKKFGNLTPEKEEKMGQNFSQCVQGFAKEFGFKGEVKMEGETCSITFSK